LPLLLLLLLLFCLLLSLLPLKVRQALQFDARQLL
jgi:hypothetical protein